jgi:hypothetical protein
MSLFGGRTDEARARAIRRLKELARALLDATEDDAVVVNELQCQEPGCPPVETVIALLVAGREPRQLKVHKPAVDVTEEDLREALHRGHAH